jgi:hypothetical protein
MSVQTALLNLSKPGEIAETADHEQGCAGASDNCPYEGTRLPLEIVAGRQRLIERGVAAGVLDGARAAAPLD